MNKTTSSNPRTKKKALTPWAIAGSHGFVAVPTVLVRNKGRLGLDDDELGLILAIMTYKWDDAAPYPSVETLADHLGWSSRKVQRVLRKLEAKDESTGKRGAYLVITPRRTGPKRNDTNLYDFTPLFTALGKLEAIAEKNGVIPNAEVGSEAVTPMSEPTEPITTNVPASVMQPPMPGPDVERIRKIPTIEAKIAELKAQQLLPLGTGSKFPGFGKPVYAAPDEDLIEAPAPEDEARTDALVDKLMFDEEMELLAENFVHAVQYVRACWGVREAQEQEESEGLDEKAVEALGQDRREYLEHLLLDGPMLAWLDVEDYRECLFEHFPEVYERVMN
jgi:hypothetical protein